MGRISYEGLRISKVPWQVELSDLRRADDGDIPLSRVLTVDGRPERHLGIPVVGQAAAHPVLGILAIRCGRDGETLIPLTLSIAESAPIPLELPPAMNMALLSNGQSNPRRSFEPYVDGSWLRRQIDSTNNDQDKP